MWVELLWQGGPNSCDVISMRHNTTMEDGDGILAARSMAFCQTEGLDDHRNNKNRTITVAGILNMPGFL